MPKSAKILLLAAVVLALATALASPASAGGHDAAQGKAPMHMAQVYFGMGGYMSVVYSSPSKTKHQVAFGTREEGALAPFGEVWRTGADEATQVVVEPKGLLVGGRKLPDGVYSLFTTPGPDEWKIYFNSTLGLWGTERCEAAGERCQPAYDASKNVVTLTVKPTTSTTDNDSFTIDFERTDEGAELVMRWGKTEVRFPVRPLH